ncbi:MAG TPA: phosphoadenosine phosphosulfate reductase [Clostridiales bacterium]|uniref:phosphoadenosine phosphosulfate reductase domain-containing protein n=1 Tax=Syntrophomonas wolfei TaxID=863 RepID=UPI000EBF94AF|nr:phosphoadenosine phosphosulfate reductase family protein [Syntrophomonas wolfei]HCS73732.1 phosphoadenosine phosphosulfate reductase [Clostridiales bacterium]
MTYWCNNCKIPIHSSSCPLCKTISKQVVGNQISPVFYHERKLLSLILQNNITESSVWSIGGAYYMVDGERMYIPYTQFLKEKKYKSMFDSFYEKDEMKTEFSGMDKLLKANTDYIQERVFEAEQYIKQTYESHSSQCVPVVSFSGGKDSTVISSLVQNALQRKDILHFMADTTLEFPFTYKYCNDVFKETNPFTPLLVSTPASDFFTICEELGPPSRRERWCCSIFKTGNLNNLIQNLPEGMGSLTFTGIRRNESTARKNYPRTRIQSKISRQIVAMPIIEWTELDVWLYILANRLNFNDAYKLGYRRVGCWCCPNNSRWSDLLTAIYLPEHYKKWRGVLHSFAIKTKKDDIEDYIENGRWRSRFGSSGLVGRNTEIKDVECFSTEMARNIISNISIQDDFLELIKPFGRLVVENIGDIYKVEIYEKNRLTGIIEFKYGSKIIKVTVGKGNDYLTFLKRIKCQLRKYQYCIQCGACSALCSQSAINIKIGAYQIDSDKCIHCKECIAHYYNGCITTEVLSDRKGEAVHEL